MRVCGVIQAGSIEELMRAALGAKAGVVELRLDALPTISPSTIKELRPVIEAVKESGRRLIVTLRDAAEGGGYKGDPVEKAGILEEIAEYSPDYVDVELDNPAFQRLAETLPPKGVGVIASHHRARPMTLDEIIELAGKARESAGTRDASGRVIVKVVYGCRSPLDELPAMQAVASTPGTLISFAAGRGCVTSRITAPLLGAPFTYAYEYGGPAAPGQPSVEEVITLWRLMGVA